MLNDKCPASAAFTYISEDTLSTFYIKFELKRMKQLCAMNKLKKVALKVISENLSKEKIILKEIFKFIDTDDS
ncbi:hypothetical protein RDI58_001792 [Solanum bulbocastanum]|uniref:Uncharacterized protein n=1 Tax=Solanum bulbocastanum TaxID=147425 RepID=A0AAN8U8K4_SOLBU